MTIRQHIQEIVFSNSKAQGLPEAIADTDTLASLGCDSVDILGIQHDMEQRHALNDYLSGIEALTGATTVGQIIQHCENAAFAP
jgi:hypothetical protein